MNHILRSKPSKMEQLKLMVWDFSHTMDKEVNRKVWGSSVDRFRMLEMVKRGHFENKKGKLKKDLPSEE